MTLVGGVIGLAVAVAASRGAQSLLFELQGSDPARAGRVGDRPGARRARRRIHPRAPRVAGRSDERAAVRVESSDRLEPDCH